MRRTAYARDGDTVVVAALDRLGRSLAGIMRTVETLRERGVMLRSLREGIDYSTPVGRMVAGIFASLAEYERELIHERAAVARQAARARGKQTGRPRALTPDQVRIARRMREAGESMSTICCTMRMARSTCRGRGHDPWPRGANMNARLRDLQGQMFVWLEQSELRVLETLEGRAFFKVLDAMVRLSVQRCRLHGMFVHPWRYDQWYQEDVPLRSWWDLHRLSAELERQARIPLRFRSPTVAGDLAPVVPLRPVLDLDPGMESLVPASVRALLAETA
jgi:hypothetical protein